MFVLLDIECDDIQSSSSELGVWIWHIKVNCIEAVNSVTIEL
jgi:hypothetical protein